MEKLLCWSLLIFLISGIAALHAAEGFPPSKSATPRIAIKGAALEAPGYLSALANPTVNPDRWFDQDKVNHLLVSAMLASGGYLGLKVNRNDHEASLAASVGVTICLGISKEIYDKYHPGQTSSWKDLTVDVIGAALGALIASAL